MLNLIMQVIYYLKLYFLTLVTFFTVDFVWLTKIAPDFYKKHIGHLLAEKPNLVAAGLFYVLFMVGLIVFSIVPALNKDSWITAALYGALFGFITYATYDLTNLATLKQWPVIVTVADLIWGTVLNAVVATIVYLISKKYFNQVKALSESINN